MGSEIANNPAGMPREAEALRARNRRVGLIALAVALLLALGTVAYVTLSGHDDLGAARGSGSVSVTLSPGGRA